MLSASAKTRRGGAAVLVFLAALAVRLIYLGRAALWGDEIIFIRYMADVSLSPWQTFLGYWQHGIAFGQLPLAGVALNIYMHVAGQFIPDIAHRVLALRIPSALMGAFFVVGTHWLAQRLVRREVAWGATAMAVCFYFPVYYSREVYCYPFVLLCAAFAYLFFHKSLFDETVSWTTVLALFLWSAGLGLAHFGCSVALAAMGGIAFGGWILNLRAHRPEPARRALWTAVACGAAGLLAAPYWVRILLGDSPHIASESPIPVLRIVNDMASKFFLGDRFLPALLAWLLLGAGLAALWHRKTDPAPARTAVLLFTLVTLMLTVLAKKSTYASSRYFALLAPVAYIVFAEGLWTVSRAAASRFRRETAARGIFYSLAGLAIAVHVVFFLPVMYRLREKGCPYASLARWLNTYAVAGAPYSFEWGGFDLRCIPGYHPTPGLTPTVFIAGNGPGFLPDVQTIQRQLMQRFPVSYYICNPSTAWDKATRFYRNVAKFPNPPMTKLRRYGIATDAETRNFEVDAREILYNTRADAIAMAREAHQPIFVDYPGFRCAPVVEEVYGRVIDGSEAELIVHNLREVPLQGAFRITGALSAPAPELPLSLTLPGSRVMDVVLPADKIWTLETPTCILPTEAAAIHLAAANPAAKKILVLDIQFVEH